MNRVGTLNVSLLYSRRAEAPSDTVPRSVQRTSYLAGEKALLILLKMLDFLFLSAGVTGVEGAVLYPSEAGVDELASTPWPLFFGVAGAAPG